MSSPDHVNPIRIDNMKGITLSIGSANERRHYNVMSSLIGWAHTVYPKKYAHGFVVLCFVVVMQSFIMNSHEVFIHIHQGCFAGTGAIVRLPQCQWSKPDGYGKISQCITTTKHSKAKTVCILLGIYCAVNDPWYNHNKVRNKLCCVYFVTLTIYIYSQHWQHFTVHLTENIYIYNNK